MHIHSEDYYLIKQLLMGQQQPEWNNPGEWSFSSVREAKILAVLLAEAQLATPRLDTASVKALCKGTIGWPTSVGDDYFFPESAEAGFEQLQELGAVSFYAGWLRVHFRKPQLENADISIQSLLHTMETLKEVRWGSDNLIRPHFRISHSRARQLTDGLIAESQLFAMAGLTVAGDNILLLPEQRQFTELLLLYLWQELSNRKTKAAAFQLWIDITMVYLGYISDPGLSRLQFDEKQSFEGAFFDCLAQDPELNTSWHKLQWRWSMEGMGNQLLLNQQTRKTPEEKKTNESPDLGRNEVVSLDELIEKLSEAYPQQQSRWQRIKWFDTSFGYMQLASVTPYDAFLQTYVKHNLRIEKNVLYCPDKLDSLVELAATKPIVECLLFYILPTYSPNSDFAIYLLAKPQTSVIGAHRLGRGAYVDWGPDRKKQSVSSSIIANYQSLLTKCLAKSVKDSCGTNLEELSSFIRDHANNHALSLTQSYRADESFIEMLLEQLSTEQIQLLLPSLYQQLSARESSHSGLEGDLYLIFKLLDKMQDVNSSAISTALVDLQTLAVDSVSQIFNKVWQEKQELYFPAHGYIANLPWDLLNEDKLGELLAILPPSREVDNGLKVVADGEQNYRRCLRNRDALRFLLQPLLQIVAYSHNDAIVQQIKQRLLQLTEWCGFSAEQGDSYLALFEDPWDKQDFDLWLQVCRISNDFTDDEFQRLLACMDNGVTVRRLLELYQHTQRAKRKQSVLDKVHNSLFRELSNEGLDGLEAAFMISVNNHLPELTSKLLDAAGQFLAERLKQFSTGSDINSHVKRRHCEWQVYRYKAALVDICNAPQLSVEQKHTDILAYAIPELVVDKGHFVASMLRDCEQFKRYAAAVALTEVQPEKSSAILQHLISETPLTLYVDSWFAACLNALEQQNAELSQYRHALRQYKEQFPQFTVGSLTLQGTQNYLSCLLKLKQYSDIDVCWLSLSAEKQRFIPIASVYCRKLKESGDIMKAREIYAELLQEYHQNADITEEQRQLFNELNDLITQHVDSKKLAVAVTTLVGASRSVDQLRRDYYEIKNQPLENLSQIVSSKKPKLFLLEHVLAVCNELLRRVAALRSDTNGQINRRIIQEDKINDWFTSLFEHRLSSWGIRCEGQKRLGDSANFATSNPGELDGYFSEAGGQGIALFEAFRLFSKDTTVITEHLNKLAGYNPEGVDPVFIIAYCQVSDFSALCTKYQAEVSNRAYVSLSAPVMDAASDETIHQRGGLYIYEEIREFRGQPLTFYHCLLDFS